MSPWNYSDKIEADSLKRIDIAWLKKHDYLDGWKSGAIEWTGGWPNNKSSIGISVFITDEYRYVNLKYSQTDIDGEKQNFDYNIQLTTTRCNYGGVRYWFECPIVKNGQYCGKRTRVLYKAGSYFGCRYCNNLTYRSKNVGRSGQYYPLFKTLRLHDDIDKLESQIKRPYYAGRPTKKQKRLNKMFSQISSINLDFDNDENRR